VPRQIKKTNSPAENQTENMKNPTKAAILSAAVALVGQGAYAQTITKGDLALGFTGNAINPAQDYIIDLGLLSSFSTTAITHLGSDITMSTFNSVFNSVNGTSVGALEGSKSGGGLTGDTFAATLTRTGSNAQNVQGTENGGVVPTTIGSRTTLSAAANLVTSTPTGTSPASGANSFATQSQSGTAGTIANDAGSTFATSAGFLSTISGGMAVMDLFQDTRGSAANSAYVYLGQLDLDLSGASPVLDFIPSGFVASAVPEPGTYGVIAGAGLLALCFRRQSRCQA